MILEQLQRGAEAEPAGSRDKSRTVISSDWGNQQVPQARSAPTDHHTTALHRLQNMVWDQGLWLWQDEGIKHHVRKSSEVK